MCPLRRGIKRLIIPELGKTSCEAVLLAVALCCKKYESQELGEMPRKNLRREEVFS